MAKLRWDNSMPHVDQTSRIPIQVFRVRSGSTSYVRVLGPFQGLWTHYVKNRSWPCPLENCQWCATIPAHKKWYAAAQFWTILSDVQGWRLCVLEITEAIEDMVNQDLKGKVIAITRRGKKPNGKLSWEIVERPKTASAPAPEPFEIEPILDRLFDQLGRHVRPVLRVVREEEVG